MMPRRHPFLVPALVPALALALLAGVFGAVLGAAPALAQTRYIAFGDSLTFGTGDDATTDVKGYPPRLQVLLEQSGNPAQVLNFGLPGETTLEGISRIDRVPGSGGDVLLLMEGTNDITARLSPETIRFNLQEIGRKATRRGMGVIHATVIPRHPRAAFDGVNRETRELAGQVRDLAWFTGRQLVDPFEVFIRRPGVFNDLYVGNGDWFHLNGNGYQLMAEVFADVLLGRDEVPPVTGVVIPEDDQQNVPAGAQVEVDLFDFGAGIDVAATTLLINGQPVEASITGDERRQEIRYRPANPFVGVVFVGLRARDLASPVNSVDRTLAQFVIRGTRFLPGDIDRDGRVDGADLISFGLAFGSARGQERFRGFADLDRDDDVDGDDLAILAANFGQSAF